jgi:hypothetical protein
MRNHSLKIHVAYQHLSGPSKMWVGVRHGIDRWTLGRWIRRLTANEASTPGHRAGPRDKPMPTCAPLVMEIQLSASSSANWSMALRAGWIAGCVGVARSPKGADRHPNTPGEALFRLLVRAPGSLPSYVRGDGPCSDSGWFPTIPHGFPQSGREPDAGNSPCWERFSPPASAA